MARFDLVADEAVLVLKEDRALDRRRGASLPSNACKRIKQMKYKFKVGDLVQVRPPLLGCTTGIVVGIPKNFEPGIDPSYYDTRVLTVDGQKRTVAAYRLKIIARGWTK